jgi:hypothetical protein
MNRLGLLWGEKRRIIIVNLILLICILAILYLKYNKKEVIINIDKGAEPRELIEVLERSNLSFENQLKIFFVFKKRPTLASLEDIDKLYHKYENIDFCAIFLNRFRLNQFFQFPYRFLARYKFVYLSSHGSLEDSSYIFLLKENKIIYVDNVLEIGRLAKVLARQVHSGSNIDDIKLSREDFRSMLHDRIKNRNISLVNIYTRDIHSLISIMLSGVERIYIIHAACTSCELSELVPKNWTGGLGAF